MNRKLIKITFITILMICILYKTQNVDALELTRKHKFEAKYTIVGDVTSNSESLNGDSVKITEDNEAEEYSLLNECKNGCIGIKHSSSFEGSGVLSNIESIVSYATDPETMKKRKKVNSSLYECYLTEQDSGGNYRYAQTIVGTISDYTYSTQKYKDISECAAAAQNADDNHLGDFTFSCLGQNWNLNNYDGFCEFVRSTNDNNIYVGIKTSGAYEDIILELANTCYNENAAIISSNYKLNCPGLEANNDDKVETDENQKYSKIETPTTTHFPSISYLNNLNDVYKLMDGLKTYSCGKISNDGKTLTISSEYATFEQAKSGCMYGLSTILKADYKMLDEKTEPVSNSSGTYECTWDVKNNDTNSTYTQSMMGSISFNSDSIKVASTQNIPKMTATLKFSYDEVKQLLEGDQKAGIYEALENSFYTSDPNAGCKAIAFTLEWVVPLAVVAVAIVTSAVSGGSTAAIGASILSTIWSSKGFIALSVISGFVLKNSCAGVEYIKESVGTGGGEVFHSHGLGGGSNVKATCIKSNQQLDPSEIIGDFDVTCKNIMSGKFGQIVRTIMNIIRFVGVALLILFGAIDFIKPIISNNQDELQKSGGKFVKRIIILILILFTPLIVELLLSLIGRSCDSTL